MHFRISGIVVLFSIGLGLFGIHIANNLWPVLPFTIALGALTFIFASRELGPSAAWLLGACGLLFGHTAIALLYPETLSGIDPDSYAVWVNQVIKSGNLSQAEIRTYTALPVFLLLISTASEVTALPPRTAFVTIPILVSVIVPLFTAWFTTLLTGCRYNEWPAVPAALISSVLTMSVARGYLPIAMTVSYLLMFLAFVVSIRFFLWRNKSDIIAFIVLGFGVTISHRLPILLLTLGVVAQAAVLPILKPQLRSMNNVVLPAIAGILLVLQWMYITTSLSITVLQTMDIFADTGAQANTGEIRKSASKPVMSASKPVIESRTLGIVARRVHGMILIPFAVISWFYFASREYSRLRRPVLLALATAAVLGAFLPLSIAYPDQLRYTRVIAIAEPVLLALVVGCGWLLWKRFESHPWPLMKSGRTTLLVFGVIVIAAQVSSAPISADHPADYRGHLESDEATAKMWGHQYAGTNISADPFFAHERPLPETHVNSEGEIREEYSERYRRMLESYTDQSIVEDCQEAIMYRDVKIYHSSRGQVLQWDPEPTLDAVYSRHYDSGRVQFFRGPQCR